MFTLLLPDLSILLSSFLLLLVLLNPLLMSVYLQDFLRELDGVRFRHVLSRGAAISGLVYALFAITGDAIFATVLQVRFASFLIFGGVLFLLLGIRYALSGGSSLDEVRGKPQLVAGAVAMPFMIGPGTVSASVLIGARLPILWALAVIVVTVALTVLSLVGLKWVLDHVKRRNALLVTRYMDTSGRISALLMGTIAVDMILRGVEMWIQELR